MRNSISRESSRSASALLVFALMSTSTLEAQCEIDEFTVAGPAAGYSLGWSSAIDGDTALFGAPYADGTGAAFVFEHTPAGWEERARLVPSDGQSGDAFGWSVALSGDYALVGAPADDDQGFESGTAFVFQRVGNSWIEIDKLTASSVDDFDGFGTSVAIDNGIAFVGAPSADGVTTNSGAVFFFLQSGQTFNEFQVLVASDGDGGDEFGKAVDMHWGMAVIGAPRDDSPGVDSGSAYVFTQGAISYFQTAKLTASDGVGFEEFGGAVDCDGSRALIGAHSAQGLALNTGAAYFFEMGGASWMEEAKLFDPEGVIADGFGYSVFLEGERALIGAPQNIAALAQEGRGYLAERRGGSWELTSKYAASDGTIFDFLGGSVLLHEDTALVGAPYEGESADQSGSIYVFDARPRLGDSFCDATENSAGLVGYLFATGSAVVADNDLLLRAECCPPNRVGLFFYGPTQVQLPLGNGFRCVGGSLRRLGPPLLTDAIGAAERVVDLAVEPALSDIAQAVPVQMNFQFWHRESAGGSNLTAATSIDFE